MTHFSRTVGAALAAAIIATGGVVASAPPANASGITVEVEYSDAGPMHVTRVITDGSCTSLTLPYSVDLGGGSIAGIVGIAPGALQDVECTSVTIPDGYEYIGTDAFKGSAITSV